MTAAEWNERVEKKGGIDRVFGTKLGLYLRINPMTKGGSKDADVTEFRHALVEFDRDKDGKPIPKAEQYRRIIESGLPVAALIDSGNKSLHAIVRVDAPRRRRNTSAGSMSSGSSSMAWTSTSRTATRRACPAAPMAGARWMARSAASRC